MTCDADSLSHLPRSPLRVRPIHLRTKSAKRGCPFRPLRRSLRLEPGALPRHRPRPASQDGRAAYGHPDTTRPRSCAAHRL